jgi:hypothetical protein
MPRSTVSVPHSWCLNDWPETVNPGSATRARYIVRAHRDDLLLAGALCRVGRELVVLGQKYSNWLERHTSEVPGYVAPPNRARAAGTAAP